MSLQQQLDKYKIIAMGTCIMMFCAFLFTLLVYYMQSTSKLSLTEYDFSTVTAGDYTVEMDITTKMYDSFLEK